jgi:hypothetical protein
MSLPSETSVAVLLEAAGLTVPADEAADFAASYAEHRAALDALFAVPMVHEEEPQLIFSPFV